MVSMNNYSEFILSRELLRYGLPILLTVGTVGSILTILVLRRKPLKQETTVFYLTVLAFADLGVLYIVLMRLWLEKVYEVSFRLSSSFACKFHMFITYCALTFCAWNLVAAIVNRCVFATFPTAARRWCTLRNARCVVIVVALVDILINLHLLWSVDLTYTGKHTIAGHGYACFHKKSLDFKLFNENVLPWITFSVLCFVPFVIILTGNCLIIRQLAVSARNLRAQRQPRKSDADRKQLRKWSIISIFSEKTSLARQIRNRKVQPDDICHKHEAKQEDTTSEEDHRENQSISSHVTELQAARQVQESVVRRNSERSVLTSMLGFRKEIDGKFPNKGECPELSLQNSADTSTTSTLLLPLRDQPQVQQMCRSSTDVARRKCCGVPSVTLFLLSVSSASCILSAPNAVFLIFSPVLDLNMSDEKEAKMELWWAIGNLLAYTNIVTHFFLYCLTVPRFRQEMMAMFRCPRSDPLLDSVRSHT